jgi:hypothetical protein
MGLKSNVNKIHLDLLHNFEVVQMQEGANKKFGNHISIIVKKDNKEISAIIEKSALEKEQFVWRYMSNPEDENSFLVERNSSIHNILSHFKDILDNNKFDKEYIKSRNH